MKPLTCALRTAVASAALLASLGAQAALVDVFDATINMFRDTRGANDIGIGQGDRIQFGANVVGGSLGTSLGATYGPTGFEVTQFPCSPLQIDSRFCARTTPFNGSRLDPWTLRFTRAGDQTLEVLGPSLQGAEQPVPFPVSVTLAGSGLTPTVSWTVPNGFVPDAFRINVHDKGLIAADGRPDQVHSVNLVPTATSYTMPAVFSGGRALAAGGNYTITLQLIETRGHVPLQGNQDILRRSSSFFSFSPLTGDNPPDVALPTVVDGVYNFNVAQVGPGSVTFIDPVVAIGYDYAIGAGDPNFASVLLPDVGDGQFTLEYTDGTGPKAVGLSEGSQYFFAPGGVSAFKVTGIETEAMLDPANATAFVTGLTFVSNGAFTGTMTPITHFVPEVPEPQTWAMLLLGLAGLGAVGRRRSAG